MEYRLKELWKFLRNTRLRPQNGRARKLPVVLQFPVTWRCNSKCVMCNCWSMNDKVEADAEEYGRFLSDPVFRNIEAAGLNGGEPSLAKDFPKIAEKVLDLPKIKFLSIISNGMATDALLAKLETIQNRCRQQDVTMHVSISLDGVGEVHDRVRGVKGVFNKVEKTLEQIQAEPGRYCSYLDIGCTVVRQNVERLVELDVWAKVRGYNIRYRLGIDNKRIESSRNRSEYSVLEAPRSKKLAAEFFHSRIPCATSLMEQFTYHAIFMFLTDVPPRRRLGCLWKEDGITLDPEGCIYYCAVASDKIGSLREGNGEMFLSPRSIAYRKRLLADNCANCIHDYFGSPLLVDALYFLLRRQVEMRWGKAYKFLARLV